MHGLRLLYCDDDPDSRYICTKVEIQIYMLSFIWTKSSVIHINRLEKTGFWSLLWRPFERGGVSNHQCLNCFLKRLFRRRSKKTSKLRVTGLCEGINRWPVDSPHKGPVTGKYLHLMTLSRVWWSGIPHTIMMFHLLFIISQWSKFHPL